MIKKGLTKEQALEEIVKQLKSFVENDPNDTALDDLYIELGNGFYISCEQSAKKFKVEMW